MPVWRQQYPPGQPTSPRSPQGGRSLAPLREPSGARPPTRPSRGYSAERHMRGVPLTPYKRHAARLVGSFSLTHSLSHSLSLARGYSAERHEGCPLRRTRDMHRRLVGSFSLSLTHSLSHSLSLSRGYSAERPEGGGRTPCAVGGTSHTERGREGA